MFIIHVDQLVIFVIVWFYGLLYDVIFAFVKLLSEVDGRVRELPGCNAFPIVI